MILVMGVNLYIVRIVLQVLGEVDYGIYNVVAGVVVMLSFLSGTMSSASQRFFAFELGKQNKEKLKKTFSVTVSIYLFLSIIILVLSESFGLWFLNYKMNIPADRMYAANWVLQFSILSFLMTMFEIPYKSLIIAYEKLSVFAYISIFEVGFRLMLVFALTLLQFDKLVVYAFLMFIVAGLTLFMYKFFCQRYFSESKYTFVWDVSLIKTLLSYSGWNMFGGLAAVMNNHGVNILLNLFFGPVINAARGVAFQVFNAINQFVQSFALAVRPQITKYYAQGNISEMMKLIFQSSRWSFFLLLILVITVLFETNYLLSFWLIEVPKYTVLFLRLLIILSLIDSLSFPLMAGAQATGKIKVYQIIVGGTMLLNVPISYVLLVLGYAPQFPFIVAIFISILSLILRILLLSRLIGLSVKSFFKEVVLVVVSVFVVSLILPFYIYHNLPEGLLRFSILSLSSISFAVVTVYFLGLTKPERGKLSHTILRQFKR